MLFRSSLDAPGDAWGPALDNIVVEKLVPTTGPGVRHLFTGKERDGETGLDYFGARYMSAAQGRFTSADPIHANILRVLNPQRWNMYAYAVNNPFAYTDPDGRDAIAVNFSRLAFHAGHAGIAVVHRDGRATFQDFGPRGGPKPISLPGELRTRELVTKVKFDNRGVATRESMAAIAEELAVLSRQPLESVSLAYFKTTDAETAALQVYIDELARLQRTGRPLDYFVGITDCRFHTEAGLRAAGIRNDGGSFAIPNLWMYLLMHRSHAAYPNDASSGSESKPDVTSTITYGCVVGEPGCQR